MHAHPQRIDAAFPRNVYNNNAIVVYRVGIECVDLGLIQRVRETGFNMHAMHLKAPERETDTRS